jgi:hypothetical protein
MLRWQRKPCVVTDCTRRGTRRFEVTSDGVVPVGLFLAQTLRPGQEIAFCRQHLRSMTATLELVEVLDAEIREP